MNLLITFFALFFSTVVMAAPLNKLVIFGDSLSDNGNLYEFMKHRMPLSPPYYQGRFSNGPVWIEQLTASYFGQDKSARYLLDYAYGGAAIADPEETDNDSLFTLKHEIDTYLLSHQNKADPKSLFIVWIGANNYLAVPNEVEKTIYNVNSGITYELEHLVKRGAKHILLINLPDLGKTPIAREFNAEAQLTQFSVAHNKALLYSFTQLEQQYPQVQWIFFDAYSSFNDIFASPQNYGFNNINDTCYETLAKTRSNRLLLNMASSIKMRDNSQNCQGYLFVDSVHSTTLAHQLMANNVRIQLDKLGIEFVR